MQRQHTDMQLNGQEEREKPRKKQEKKKCVSKKALTISSTAAAICWYRLSFELENKEALQ